MYMNGRGQSLNFAVKWKGRLKFFCLQISWFHYQQLNTVADIFHAVFTSDILLNFSNHDKYAGTCIQHQHITSAVAQGQSRWHVTRSS